VVFTLFKKCLYIRKLEGRGAEDGVIGPIVVRIVEVRKEPFDAMGGDIRRFLVLEVGKEETLDVVCLSRGWKSSKPRPVRELNLEMMLFTEGA